MPFLTRILEGRWLLYIGLAALAVGLPLSRALISIAPGILGGYWLFDGLFRKDFGLKFKRLKKNKAALLFMAFFLLYALAGLYSSDGANALKIISNKIPWLVLPLAIVSAHPMPAKNWRYLLILHVAAVSASSLLSYANLVSIESWAEPKSAILFVNHIRLSLMLVLAMITAIYLTQSSSNVWKGLTAIFCLWALYFMYTFEIATGLAVAMLLLLVLGVYGLRSQGLYRVLGVLALVMSLAAIIYVASVGARQLYKPLVKTEISTERTALGSPYTSLPDNNLTENGHYVWHYLALDEMRDAWNKRATIKMSDVIEESSMIEGGLIRYLTSKGLRKDAAGVNALSQTDIGNIESGHPSVMYSETSGIRKRLYMLFYEVDAYRNGGDPSLSSMTIKWEYWRSGFQLIKENPLLGVGTGDVRHSFEQVQAEEGRISPDAYDKAHNQYITWFVTFGVLGGSIALYLFLGPYLIARRWGQGIMAAMIYLVFLISFITEDTFENQFGLNLFLFYALFFIITPPQTSSSTSA